MSVNQSAINGVWGGDIQMEIADKEITVEGLRKRKHHHPPK
jgi:hypothetical protein